MTDTRQSEAPVLVGAGDFAAQREAILARSLAAVQSAFPVENDLYRLALEDVGYDKKTSFTRAEQKRAMQTDGSLFVRMKGRWALTDKKTGKLLGRTARKGIMDVPYMTERGTFIRGGTEVTVPVQMRLVPGVYARLGEDGQARAHINVRQGTGNSVTMTADPANPVFRLKVGTRNYRLYPLLRHLGVDDRELHRMWGEGVYRANFDDFVKGGGWYAGKTTSEAPVDGETGNPYDAIAKDVIGGELDETNTAATFGKPFAKVDPELLTQTSLRLLQVTRGDLRPDNRDSLENQRFFGMPELISERVRLDAGGVARNILWRVSRDGDVNRIPGGALTRYVHGLFTESNLPQVIEETNPLDAYARATRLTRMGEGGIASVDSAPMSARMVHNTYKGFIDAVATPESLRVGLDSQMAHGVRLGSDGLAYTPMIDAATGKRVMVNSVEAGAALVGFPEFRDTKARTVPAMRGEDIDYVPREKIQYWLPSGDHLFALTSNMIPIKGGIKAGRLTMAQKHQTQAVPLPSRMAPFVRTRDPEGEGESVEERSAEILGAVRSGTAGEVVSVTPDEIVVRPDDGGEPVHYSLYNHHPLNRATMVHNTPVVKAGDRVGRGQLLAPSNYTDDKGLAALGTQLTTAWLPYKGYNYLDGIVISETAARKLSSEHLFRISVDKDSAVTYSKNAYVGTFPTRYDRDQVAALDENGVVRPGTVLRKGDPMILGLRHTEAGPGTLHRPLARDASETWDREFDGTVIDVVSTDKGVKVYTKAVVPAQVGDKLASRFANKGTVGLVVPDAKMPRGADGNPLEVLFSPTGIVSRVNSACLVEAALGKAAAKTGKRYVLPGFMDESLVDFARRELEEAGLSDREDVTDPEDGTIIPGVFTGNSYITKFHHTSESKAGARSTGGYTADGLPGIGGDAGAKSLGGLVLGAIVAHGGTGILEDLKLIKGQRNTDFWRDFKMGRTPAMPKTPLVYERFLAHLEGAGIHVSRRNGNTDIFALTDKDVSSYARAPLENGDTFDSATMRPLRGGLFDPAIFGPDGNQWARIDLDEPIPNPVMEDVIRNLLDLRAADLDAVIAGAKSLPNGKTGGKGLFEQLKSIDLDRAIKDARETILRGSKSRRDKAVKTYRWLNAMKKHGAHPADFMLSSVPVLPPKFRSITRSGGMDMIADANYLYKALMDARDDARAAIEAGVPDDMAGMGRLGVYNAFKAVTGLAEPADRQLREKSVDGLLTWVFGKGSPKCHDAATELLTLDGFVPVADITPLSLCAYVTRGAANADVRYAAPGAVTREDWKGDMIRFLADGVDLLVTPQHKCLVAYRENADWPEYSLVRADHLRDAGVPFYMATAADCAATAAARLIRPGDIATEDFDGAVYGVSVPSGVTVVRRGGISCLTGNSGKFHRSVVGGTLDVAGRAVINADPELGMDEVGLPISQAWDVYKDFVIRKLVQNGSTVLQATKEVAERNKHAEDALRQVVKERPLHLTRAPALHKYSVMAFWPKLIGGDTLQLNSMVQIPFNADFDGNCCDFDTEIILKSALDNEFLSSILEVMTSRGGKSITKGDTEMITSDTMIFLRNCTTGEQIYRGPIGEVPRKGTPVKDKNGADIYDIPSGVSVLSYDENSARGIWSPITKFTVEQDCPCVEVTIGQQKVVVSANESLAVFDTETGLLKKAAPADAIGKYVPRLKKSLLAGNEGTFEEGWLHGAFIGDGWLSERYVGFTKLEGSKRDRFIAALTAAIGKAPGMHIYSDVAGRQKYGDSIKVHFNDPAVVAYFSEQSFYDWSTDVFTEGERAGTTERGALHKRIPAWWLENGSEEYLWGVFSGLMDTDGSVYRNIHTGKPRYGCRLSTCSPFLKNTFLELCYRLGVRCCVTDTIHKKSKTRKVTSFEYSICPSSVDIQMNLDKIHCAGIQESAMLAEWKESPLSEDQRDVIPLSGKEIKLLRRLFPHTVAGGFYASLGKGVAMRKKLAERLASLADDADDLRMLRSRVANTNTVWDKVKQATSVGPREVFDFCVPDTKVFVVDRGLVIWDTMTYYVPVSDRAVKESVDKMLPSKNLLAARDYKAHYFPQEEIVLGAYLASRPGKGPVKKVFRTREEALLAYRKGEIDLNDNIQVAER